MEGAEVRDRNARPVSTGVPGVTGVADAEEKESSSPCKKKEAVKEA
jgi:hypothetical protein